MSYKNFRSPGLILVLFVLIVFIAAGLSSPPALSQPGDRSEFLQQPAVAPTPPARGDFPEDSDDVIRVETNLTNIFFTAADKSKRFINTLKQDDIRVYEDGKLQEVFTFQQNIDLPLSVALLLDTSVSVERTLPDEKAAARSFLEAVVRSEKDEAAVISFTGEVVLEQGFSGSLARLRNAIDRVEFVPPAGYIGGGVVVGGSQGTPPIFGRNNTLAGNTAVWDAVWVASNELFLESAQNTRRAIILLTDGDDTISQVKMQEAIESAQKADAFVYAIGIGDSYRGGVDQGALRKIAERTGGRAYFPRSEQELREAFAQIQSDLREQYLLAYSPSNKARDGSYREIKIEVVDPELRKSLKLNYRPGYFAKTSDPVRATKP
ncbi:MAG TPA: VWA domain-containing protein [Pyrinomonadaceae bacterium]|nr:VWA domain-containing protein [Pyrinomonadaceae bacterium]